MIDRSAPEWQTLKADLVRRLNVLRTELEQPSTGELTDMLRGRCAEIRRIIEEVEPGGGPAEITPDYV
jgi:hypothetical protein